MSQFDSILLLIPGFHENLAFLVFQDLDFDLFRSSRNPQPKKWIDLEHNLFKNVSKESLFCDKRKFKRLNMALMNLV